MDTFPGENLLLSKFKVRPTKPITCFILCRILSNILNKFDAHDVSEGSSTPAFRLSIKLTDLLLLFKIVSNRGWDFNSEEGAKWNPRSGLVN